ncbi:MAG: flagellar type III secretion system protein FliQ [Synergistaceae bacterium]|jgi:flagellar biosynthetic protein FliQ|nr:flagellar type III secretion system protein FliQ [Synergistaceae bacterium]
MESLSIADAMTSAMMVTVLAGMPILLIAMAVGLIVGILQTATSIQEQTLAFIPKILAVLLALVLLGPWIFSLVRDLAVNLFTNMYKYVG